jgi:hypothetical protein
VAVASSYLGGRPDGERVRGGVGIGCRTRLPRLAGSTSMDFFMTARERNASGRPSKRYVNIRTGQFGKSGCCRLAPAMEGPPFTSEKRSARR